MWRIDDARKFFDRFWEPRQVLPLLTRNSLNPKRAAKRNIKNKANNAGTRLTKVGAISAKQTSNPVMCQRINAAGPGATTNTI